MTIQKHIRKQFNPNYTAIYGFRKRILQRLDEKMIPLYYSIYYNLIDIM